MGWLYSQGTNASEGDPHEGWVVAVLSSGDADRDTLEDVREAWERELSWAWSFKYDGQEGRRKAQGVRVICACGWRGPRRPADFTDPDACDAELKQRWARHCEVSLSRMLTERLTRLFAQLGETFEKLNGRLPLEHEPARPLLAVYATTRLQADAETQQLEAVRMAKAAGFSWDEIGDALGMSKQSAWEKFADLL